MQERTNSPCQVRCSISRVQFGEIRREVKPFEQVGYLLLERTLLLRQRQAFHGSTMCKSIRRFKPAPQDAFKKIPPCAGRIVLTYAMGDRSPKDQHRKAKQKHAKDDAADLKKRGNAEQQHHPAQAFSLPARKPQK